MILFIHYEILILYDYLSNDKYILFNVYNRLFVCYFYSINNNYVTQNERYLDSTNVRAFEVIYRINGGSAFYKNVYRKNVNLELCKKYFFFYGHGIWKKIDFILLAKKIFKKIRLQFILLNVISERILQ